MDLDLERNLRETIEDLRRFATEDLGYDTMDPIVKMMLTALLHESQKIRDMVNTTPEKVVEHFCADFIPYEAVKAMPAIALLAPSFKQRKDEEIVSVTSGVSFTYKVAGSKQPLNYLPIFGTTLIPHLPTTGVYLLTHDKLSLGGEVREVKGPLPNRVWLGIRTKAEIECLQGVSLLVTGTHGILPEKICVGTDFKELEISTMQEMENIEMLEPFDAQQASGQLFSIVNSWKESLLNMNDAALLYITDATNNRDLFKPKAFPKPFQQWFEDEVLDCFDDHTFWLRLDFPQGYTVPDSIDVAINILPVANVDVNTLMLTPSSPIAKLQKQDHSFFLSVLETSLMSQKTGFSKLADEIIVRDFEANSYHNGDLYRDVRTLYNHFIDDYYAFVEYNDIKDGDVLKRLRDIINHLDTSVTDSNEKFKFDSGTYVMKKLNPDAMTSSTRVSYLTTMGERGNAPQFGENMEAKKLPSVELKVPVIMSAMGGADKASADARYEMLRYFALTNDRLYTKMDVDAFLRKEIMAEFGKEEFHRIFIRISIQGAGGEKFLRRGLYVDIEFKDQKNYDQAVKKTFDKLMKQKIENHSCIAMPIIVTLKNLEK